MSARVPVNRGQQGTKVAVAWPCVLALASACYASYRVESDWDPLGPGAPRPLRPENGALTGSPWAPSSFNTVRPAFRWRPSADDAPPAEAYEIQVDDSCGTPGFADCGFPSPEASAAGVAATSWRPEAPLPVSDTAPVGRRYYWRVRGWRDDHAGRWSAVRYVDVGRVARDFNGDGYSDVVVGARYQSGTAQAEGAAHVYYGGPAGVRGEPDVTLRNPLHDENGHFGWSVASTGDLDADGFADLVVGAPENDAPRRGSGSAYVFHGSASGLGTEPDWTLADPWMQEDAFFGWSVATAGDVEADGYADLVVGARSQRGETENEGAVFVFPGSASGVSASSFQGVRAPSPVTDNGFGYTVLSFGDANGDGHADLAVGAPWWASAEPGEGTAWVFPGGPEGVRDAAGSALYGAPGDDGTLFGWSLATAGDLDGDGLADLLVGDPGRDSSSVEDVGRVTVFHGRDGPGLLAPQEVLEGEPPVGDGNPPRFGSGVSGAGDYNGDGSPDFAVLCSVSPIGSDLWWDTAAVFFSRAGEILTPAASWLQSDRPQFAVVGSAGDINGDGFSDLVLGFAQRSGGGEVFVFYGSTTGLPATASIVLPNPDGETFGDFGGSLARAVRPAGVTSRTLAI